MSEKETWYHNKWRPTIGWLYALIVFFDFLVMPAAWTVMQFWMGQNLVAWEPITYGGGGLFHTTMLGIIGVAVAGRSLEKWKGVASDQRVG